MRASPGDDSPTNTRAPPPQPSDTGPLIETEKTIMPGLLLAEIPELEDEVDMGVEYIEDPD